MSSGLPDLRQRLLRLQNDPALLEALQVAQQLFAESGTPVGHWLNGMRGTMSRCLASAVGFRQPADLEAVDVFDLLDPLCDAMARADDIGTAIGDFVHRVFADILVSRTVVTSPVFSVSEADVDHAAGRSLRLDSGFGSVTLSFARDDGDHLRYDPEDVGVLLQVSCVSSPRAANRIAGLAFDIARSIARSSVVLIDARESWKGVVSSQEWDSRLVASADLTGMFDDANTSPAEEVECLLSQLIYVLPLIDARHQDPAKTGQQINRFERSMARAIRFLVEADRATDMAVAVMCCFAAIESILGEDVERLTDTLAMRSAALLAGSGSKANRREHQNFFKARYGNRCKVVHGARWEISFEEWVRCRTLAAAVLRAALEWAAVNGRKPANLRRAFFAALDDRSFSPNSRLAHLSHLWRKGDG